MTLVQILDPQEASINTIRKIRKMWIYFELQSVLLLSDQIDDRYDVNFAHQIRFIKNDCTRQGKNS